MDVRTVILSEDVKKLILKRKIPLNIQQKLHIWAKFVFQVGLVKVREMKGFHDEPLQGKKFGRRSIRLSKSWRAEYKVYKNSIEFALIEEIHNHEY